MSKLLSIEPIVIQANGADVDIAAVGGTIGCTGGYFTVDVASEINIASQGQLTIATTGGGDIHLDAIGTFIAHTQGGANTLSWANDFVLSTSDVSITATNGATFNLNSGLQATVNNGSFNFNANNGNGCYFNVDGQINLNSNNNGLYVSAYNAGLQLYGARYWVLNSNGGGGDCQIQCGSSGLNVGCGGQSNWNLGADFYLNVTGNAYHVAQQSAFFTGNNGCNVIAGGSSALTLQAMGGIVNVTAATDVNVTAAGGFFVNASGNSSIDTSSGTFNINATNGFTFWANAGNGAINAAAALSFSANNGDLTLANTSSGDIVLTSLAKIRATAGGEIDFTSPTAPIQLSSSALGNESHVWVGTSGGIEIMAGDGQTVAIFSNSGASFDGGAGAFDLDGATCTIASTVGALALTGANVVNVTATEGAVTLDAADGNVVLHSGAAGHSGAFSRWTMSTSGAVLEGSPTIRIPDNDFQLFTDNSTGPSHNISIYTATSGGTSGNILINTGSAASHGNAGNITANANMGQLILAGYSVSSTSDSGTTCTVGDHYVLTSGDTIGMTAGGQFQVNAGGNANIVSSGGQVFCSGATTASLLAHNGDITIQNFSASDILLNTLGTTKITCGGSSVDVLLCKASGSNSEWHFAGQLSVQSAGNVENLKIIPSGIASFANITQLVTVAGAIGAPGLAFAGSTAAGFYAPAHNVVALAIAGAEKIRCSAGDVLLTPSAGSAVVAKTHAGYSEGGIKWDTSGYRTTDGNAQLGYIYTLDDNTVYTFEFVVTCRDEAGTHRGSFKRRLQCYRQGGGACVVSYIETIGTDYKTSASLQLTANAGSNDIRVLPTGIAATNIDWEINATHSGVSLST